MNEKLYKLIEKLSSTHSLSLSEYEYLISNRSDEAAEELRKRAVTERVKYYGHDVYIRGLIEIGNVCRNDCLYCGIRRGNKSCDRYRLTEEEILSCCEQGYRLGFRTFVMQGGEDNYFDDERMCRIINGIKRRYPDSAVTLSLGEKSRESYQKLFDAGADRYLLRHETADKAHYEKLHPKELSFENRMRCLRDLKEIGFQVGCGFMVGSPYQTDECLAKDLKFIEGFEPDMCGIGPFVPHKDTPFAEFNQGSAELTCYLLSIVRLIRPNILLPSTTALGTILPDGRERGILSGANVVMPNLSPETVRSKYELYNGKISTGAESAQQKEGLAGRMEKIGYRIVTAKGDVKK